MFASSIAAEDAFYEAFSNADLEAMMRVWAYSFDVACIHPSGPRLEGIPAIRRSWQEIFAGGVPRGIELRGRIVVGSDDFRIHMLEENLSAPGTGFTAPPVLATNVYQRLADGWYIVLHHAGVAPQSLPEDIDDDGSAEPPRLH